LIIGWAISKTRSFHQGHEGHEGIEAMEQLVFLAARAASVAWGKATGPKCDEKYLDRKANFLLTPGCPVL